MNRKNSRNPKQDSALLDPHHSSTTAAHSSHLPSSHFNSTQATSSAHPSHHLKQSDHLQPVLPDLYKASSTQRQQEMFQILQKIPCPNESMTLSSFSTSPYIAQKNKKQSYNLEEQKQNKNGLKIQNNEAYDDQQYESQNEDDDSYGRRYSNNNVEDESSPNNSLSITNGTNRQNNVQIDETSEQEFQEEQSPNHHHTVEISNSNMAATREELYENDNNNNNSQDEELEEEDKDNDISINRSNMTSTHNGKDSPDFNRHQNTYDDLTISNTVVSNTTYRGNNRNNQRSIKEKSMVFADSVLKQQQQKQYSTANSNSQRSYFEHSDNIRQNINFKNNYGQQTTDENDVSEEDKSIIEREQEQEEDDDDDDQIDSSDISGIESLQQTQISKFSKFQSKSFIRRQNQKQDASEDQLQITKRSPYNQRLQEESLNLTPSSYDEGKQWIQSQKSGIGNRQMQINNRTTASDQSNQNRLGENLNQLIKNQNFNNTAAINKHNSSLQRDPELLQALEEDSQQQINSRMNSIESGHNNNNINSMQSDQEFKRLQIQLAQLQISNKQLNNQLKQEKEQNQEKLIEIQNYMHEIEDIHNRYKESQEHLTLLKMSIKDNQSLQQLRGRMLDQAKSEIKQLAHQLEQKQMVLNQVENKLQKKKNEKRNNEDDVKQMIKQYIDQIEQGKIIQNSLKKQNNQLQNDKIKLEEKSNKEVKLIKENQQKQLDELNQYNKQLTKKIQELNQDIHHLNLHSQELQSYLQDKDLLISDLKQEKLQQKESIHLLSQRCKDLEKELDYFRPSENNSIFGNTNNNTTSFKDKNSINNQGGYEAKQVKHLFDQKLQKERENAKKLQQQCDDLKNHIKKMEEEHKQSFQNQITQFQTDQNLQIQIDKLKQQLNCHVLFEMKFKECFEMKENEDPEYKLLEINQQLEELKVLKKQIQIYQEQLAQIQNKEKLLLKQSENKENQSNQGTIEMSNFMKQLVENKSKEMMQLKEEINKQKFDKQNLEDKLYQAEYQENKLKQEIEKMKIQIEVIEGEIQKYKEMNKNADKNIDELKSALREKIREIQILEKENQESKNNKYSVNRLDQVDKKRYDELINYILDLQLVDDPLSNENLMLQQSFIDEQEQAIKHLKEQQLLVTKFIDSLSQDKHDLSSKFQSLDQEHQHLLKELHSMNTDSISLKEQIKNKNTQLEILNIEQIDLIEQCKKLSTQLQESEIACQKIMKENMELNTSINKIMRTQNNLFKNTGQNKSSVKNIENNENSREQEIQNMIYEDQCSKLLQLHGKLQNMILDVQKEKQTLAQNENTIRDIYRKEVMEMLDKLIDCKTNMPTFNDLALQLSQRIDKVRSQERIKNSYNQKQENVNNNSINFQKEHLKSSKGSEKQMEETFKQEMDSLNNEEELVQSIARFLKQSQGNPNGKQFKNFFNNEDNTSLLLFSELITQQNNNNQTSNNIQDKKTNNQQVIDNLQSQLNEKENEILRLSEELQQLQQLQDEKTPQLNQENQLQLLLKQKGKSLQYLINFCLDLHLRESQDLISKLQQQNQEFKQKLSQKDDQLRSSEQEWSLQQRKKEDLQKQQSLQMKQDFDSFKEEMKKQLIEQSDKLDQEYQFLDLERNQIKENYEKYKQDLDSNYCQKYDQQEKEFREKLLKMELEVRSGCEKSKEQLVTNIYKDMEDQHHNQLKILKDEHLSYVQSLKLENQKQIDDVKRLKDRDLKRLKEDLDKLKKHYEDKIKKIESDYTCEKEQLENDYKQKIENLSNKQKKEAKNQSEKVRAEMRNQVDSIKNEMAKAKAEWEREKKKIMMENKNEMEKQKQESEEQQEINVRGEKEKIEKKYKKKMEQSEKEWKEKINNIEDDIKQIKENHLVELKKERERIESRLREQLTLELRFSLQEQLESDFKLHLDNLKASHSLELEKYKQRFDLHLRDSYLSPLPLQLDSKSVEIQCSLDSFDFSQPKQFTNNNIINQSSVNQSSYSQVTQSQGYIEQLKFNFEEELERQQQIFEIQLVQRQNSSVKIFEEIITLEFDKILQSIFHKQQTSSNKNTRDLEEKRREINQIIADILNRNDDRKEKQMRMSLDRLKQKVTNILRVFKAEVEKKTIKNIKNQSKSISDVMMMMSNTHERSQSQISSQDDTQSMQSQQQQEYKFQKQKYMQSEPNTMPPTPRSEGKKMESIVKKNGSGEKKQQQQLEQERSDVKKYIEFIDEKDEINENILKKVAPVPNKQGVLIVEVDKIVRDLKMLMQTVKQAKFYRLLMAVDDQFSSKIEEYENLDEERGNGEQSVQLYRQLLNDFFRLVVKLNQGVDQLTKSNELYRLKLTISDLKLKLNSVNKSNQLHDRQLLIEEILNYYGQVGRSDYLGTEGQKLVLKLEQTQFQINKLQFGLFQLVDLFTTNQKQSINGKKEKIEVVNKNNIEVIRKCSEYNKQNQNQQIDGQLTQSQLLSSQCSPEQMQKINPEMLSPEETAQLIAAVFQRLNETTIPYSTNGFSAQNNTNYQNNNNNRDNNNMYSSFFKTFMSNEEYIKSAENFIQKYKQHQYLNQTLRNPNRQNNISSNNNNLDYYNTQNIERTNQISNQNSSKYVSIQSCPPLQMPKKRSKSQNSAQNISQQQIMQRNNQQNQQFQSQYQQIPHNYSQANSLYNQKVSNVFQTNVLADSKYINSVNQQQPILISNYESQSQFSSQFQPQKSIENFNIISQNDSNNEQLRNAQININSLFNQLKKNSISQNNEL